MKAPSAKAVTFALPAEHQMAHRQRRQLPCPQLDIPASAAFALIVFLLLIHLEVAIATAVPLSVLVGLLSRYVFRLIADPGKSDVFVPMTLVVGYFVMDFAIRAFYLSTSSFFPRIGRNPYDDCIPVALWCACAAYVSVLLGAHSRVAERLVRRLPTPSARMAPQIPVWRLVILMAIGVASLVYLFKLGIAVGNYANPAFAKNPPPGVVVLLENLTHLSWAVICVYLIVPGSKSERGFAWVLLSISMVILCAKLAITGGKVAIIQPLIEAMIVWHYCRRRFRIWELVAIGIPVLAIAFGAVNFYRFVVIGQHGSPKSVTDVVSRISSASDLLNLQHVSGGKSSTLEAMADRNAGVDAVALIMKYTPRPFPYALGVHWLEIPLTFVPRQIWKNKPVNMPSAEFESTYMGLPASFNGFSSIHFAGDLYRNFSWPGVLCGMFLLGVLLRAFWLFCSPSPSNLTGVFLYAAIFPEIIHSLEADVGYSLINVTRAVLLAISVAIFLGARFRRVRVLKVVPQCTVKSRRTRIVAISSDADGRGFSQATIQ